MRAAFFIRPPEWQGYIAVHFIPMLDAKLRVLENCRVAASVNILRYEAPASYASAKPGQFVNIKPLPFSPVPLLRRPMSIFERTDKYFSVLIKIAGEGTRQLYEAKEGEFHQVLGPLGTGFSLNDGESFSVLLGAGVGAAPMLGLEKELRKENRPFRTFIAARTREELTPEFFTDPSVATDDGSTGFKGNILECFVQYRKKIREKNIKIYACGPLPFLKAVQEYALKNKIPCELSLETTMGCGFGICMGCAVASSDAGPHGESKGMYLACTEGPCMDAEKIKLP